MDLGAPELHLPYDLKPFTQGGGWIENHSIRLFRLCVPAIKGQYTDAQLDNYQGLARSRFPIEPPFRLKLQARISRSSPLGTFGFGLWNDPFSFSIGLAESKHRWPNPPNALWFFYGSPPNEMQFDPASTGRGWVASCIVSPPIPAIALVPGAALAFLLARLPLFRSAVIATMQRAIHAEETALGVDFTNWHSYEINWEPDEVIFSVDQKIVHRCSTVPSCPLGLVIWIDNQYAVLSQSGGIQFGVIPLSQPQWMEIAYLNLMSAA